MADVAARVAAVIMIPWNGRSRCMESVIATRGTGDHDALEWVITMPWNDCSRWCGARNPESKVRKRHLQAAHH
jgi:hypothetical protein